MCLTSKIGVIILHVAAASLIQDLQLGLVGFGDVSKVLLVGTVHIMRVCLALKIAHVVPVRSGKSDLQVLDLVLGNLAGQIPELIDVGTTDMLDLPRAEDRLARLVASLEEGRNVGSICAEYIRVKVGHFIEAVQAGEERAPEHWYRQGNSILQRVSSLTVAAVLAI